MFSTILLCLLYTSVTLWNKNDNECKKLCLFIFLPRTILHPHNNIQAWYQKYTRYTQQQYTTSIVTYNLLFLLWLHNLRIRNLCNAINRSFCRRQDLFFCIKLSWSLFRLVFDKKLLITCSKIHYMMTFAVK